MLLFAVVACGAIGCASNDNSRARTPSDARARNNTGGLSNTDPCAMRLHDISGAILFYYAIHHQLPPTLDDLRALSDYDQPEYICPESKLPYIYNPTGLPTANQPGAKIVMYDASPAHAGMRWAISITESGVPTTKVIAVREEYFAAGSDSRPTR